MKEYIEREAVKTIFDSIYDCADMVFEPNDQCCSADDCGRCKWAQTKNAIKKMVMAIPTADVVEVRKAKWVWLSSTYDRTPCEKRYECSNCHHETITHNSDPWEKFCPNCGASMDKEVDKT